MFHGRPGRAWLAAIALAGASCLAATGCGGPTAASLNAAPSGGTGAADPLAAVPGSQVEKEALANLKAASTVAFAGSLTESGTNYTLNVGIKRGVGCKGTIAEGSQGSFKLILIGKVVYLNPDTQFWKSNAAAAASAVIAVVKGRYIKTDTSKNGMASVASLCDLTKAIASVPVSGTAPKHAVTTLNGVRVLPIENSGKSVVYVTDTSKPELVKVVATKGDAGTLTFAENTPVVLTPPPASQVIEGSQVGL